MQALQLTEREQITQSGQNDVIAKAELIPLGNGPGQRTPSIFADPCSYSLYTSDFGGINVDIDTFAFDLKAGDVLDIATLGTAGTIDLFDEQGIFWAGTSSFPTSNSTPVDSPIQTIGNSTLAVVVVPEDGRYYLSVTPLDTSSNYVLGLRTYRPVAEQLPVGVGQVIYMDLDGGFYPASLFLGVDDDGIPVPGVIRVPSLQESLPNLGIEVADSAALNELIDKMLAEMERHFAELGVNGNAGDYDFTGVKGDFGVTILNSRDHADPGSHPLVTRVHVGGVNELFPDNDGLLGISSTLDVGNFSMDDIVVAFTEPILPAPVPCRLRSVLSPMQLRYLHSSEHTKLFTPLG